ncbi:MAG: hypothetical protein EOP84_00270 [Verrucomicrobiaceae bacterium]|nr:MAG: hypothetical protein EOP84_00270 [Verrucomicrobiaceae bacterium]
MTFEGYFDDSNSHPSAPLILWAGFVGYRNQWALLAARWRDILAREGLPYFHMVACEQGDPPFDRRDPSRAWRDALIHDLREAIFKAGLFGIAAGVPYAEWDKVVTPEMEEWVGVPKSVAMILCFATATQHAPKAGWSGPVNLFFDQGVEPKAIEVANWIAASSNGFTGRADTAQFLPVKATAELQAADMFAWELQNDMKRYLALGPDRPLRPHYVPWLAQQKDVQFLEADVLRARLATPEFRSLLDDDLWQ